MTAFAITFAALFALDFVWVGYTRAVTTDSPARAGAFAGAIILLSGVAAINYTQNAWLLIPAVLGAFAGTWCAIQYANAAAFIKGLEDFKLWWK